MSGKIITLVQARLSSTRLPRKVFLPLLGEPLLVRMLERVRAAKLIGELVLVTTSDPVDDPLVNLCSKHNLAVFRGHPTDLLDRHYQAAKHLKADIVLKIPSDCPLISPEIIDLVIADFQLGKADYVSNLHPATYPDGNDVEVMKFSVLEEAWNNAHRQMEREHTTPYIWERPEQYRIRNVAMPGGKDYSMTHRWTIDYPEDYTFIKAVYEALYPANPAFTFNDIMQLLAEQPQLMQINAQWAGVNWYRNHLSELTTIDASQTRSV